MKKATLLILLCIPVLLLKAQFNVSKTSLVGKWEIAIFSFGDLVYYDLSKDSLYLASNNLNTSLANPSEIMSKLTREDNTKSLVKGMYFVFNTDDTYTTSTDTRKTVEHGIYQLSGNNDTLIMQVNQKINDVIPPPNKMKVYLKNGRLILSILNGNQLLTLELKKTK
jgi:hypothetical protein